MELCKSVMNSSLGVQQTRSAGGFSSEGLSVFNLHLSSTKTDKHKQNEANHICQRRENIAYQNL